MEYEITGATNFLRVFRLPQEFPSEYCFGGGHPATFVLVDWFNAFPPTDFWEEKVKKFNSSDSEYTKRIEELKNFIKGKKYFVPIHTYMVLTDYGDVFLVNPEKRARELQKEMDVMKEGLANGQS